MSKVHGWDKQKAKSARLVHNLNLKREIKPQEDKKSKCKPYTGRFICPVEHCLKQVVRLRNHLRQFHKIQSKEEVDRKVAVSQKVMEFEESNESDTSDTGSSDSDNEIATDEDEVKRLFSKAVSEREKPEEMLEGFDSEDSNGEYIAEKYFEIVSLLYMIYEFYLHLIPYGPKSSVTY